MALQANTSVISFVTISVVEFQTWIFLYIWCAY